MSNRNLVILAVVAAVMVLWALLQSHISRSSLQPAQVTISDLVQGLEPANIAHIELDTRNDTIRLTRRGRGFVVATKDDYPAVSEEINKLIVSCLDIQVSERISTDPQNHEVLDVTEDKAQKLVRFLDKDQKLITGIVIGKHTEDGRGSYVRLITGGDVYIMPDLLSLRSSAMDFIDKDLLKVARGEIVRVTITGPEGSYTLRPADANGLDVVLDGMPQDKKLKADQIRQVFSALGSLRFDDVKKHTAVANLNFTSTYVCELKNSTLYTLQIAKKDDETFARCTAEFLGQKPGQLAGQASEEQLANQAAENFAERHKGWVYQIPGWEAENLTRKLSELIEQPAEKPSAEKPEKTSAPNPTEQTVEKPAEPQSQTAEQASQASKESSS